uniref:Phage protein n=1 Tax=Steinernema glaseri TaxID=37863 RepID=A0A1I7XYI7_9BILA
MHTYANQYQFYVKQIGGHQCFSSDEWFRSDKTHLRKLCSVLAGWCPISPTSRRYTFPCFWANQKDLISSGNARATL